MSCLVVTMTYMLNRRRDSDLHLIEQTKGRREKEPARLSAGQKGRGKGAAAERPPGGQRVGHKYKQCDCLRKSNGERGVRRRQGERGRRMASGGHGKALRFY